MQNRKCYIVAVKPGKADESGNIKTTLVCVSTQPTLPTIITQFYYYRGNYERGVIIAEVDYEELVASEMLDDNGEACRTTTGQPLLMLGIGETLTVRLVK